MHTMLDGVSSATRKAMHQSVLRHRSLFLWSEAAGGRAYNVTMHELCWRARHRHAGVDCSALLPHDARALVVPPPVRRKRKGGLGAAWWRRERAYANARHDGTDAESVVQDGAGRSGR